MMTTPKFLHKNSNFHQELKNRVNQYFIDNNKSSTGTIGLYIKALFFFLSYLALYVHLVYFTPATWLAIVECILLGGFTAAIGFNVMHDGGHGSFSKYKAINYMAATSVNFLGASHIMWKMKHNIIHHTYTNIDGVDDDIEIQPYLRMCASQKKYKMHRFQHYYFWFLYSFLHLIWVFQTDYQKYFQKRIGNIPIKKMSLAEHFAFWGAKIMYAVLFMVIPIIKLGFLKWLVGFLIASMVTGFVISIIFQLAHTVENLEFPTPDAATHKMENEWAIHQLQTTANFATKNKLVSWLIGGLNFQIEHHLFPKISHVHYPAISKIIKQTCAEFDVKYHEFKRLHHAVISHAMYLRKMGRA